MLFSSCYKNPSLEKYKFDLYKAIVKDESKKVLSLLAMGVPVNFNIKESWRYPAGLGYSDRLPAPAWGDLPLIHLAAMVAYNTDILKLLCDAGANIHDDYELSGYKESGSILHNALHYHTRVKVFEFLINSGANVNAKNSNGISVVTALLTVYSGFNKSPNIYADRIDILKMLINKGEVLSKDDINNIYKFVITQKAGIDDAGIEVLQLSLGKDMSYLEDVQHALILHLLAVNLNVNSETKRNFVTQILRFGMDLNKQNESGQTALYLAAKKSNLIFMQMLLQQKDVNGGLKLDVNIADKNDVTPLHCAAEKSVESLRILIDNGANRNAKDNKGQTITHYAAKNDTLDALLAISGVDFDLPDNEGITPLMCAIQTNKLNNIERLIDAGANIFATDNEGRDILHYALADSNTLTYLRTKIFLNQTRATQKLALV